MKKFVLGALLAAAASSTGCVASTEAVVTAEWSFEHVNGTVSGQCPAGYPDVGIYFAPWDPVNENLGAAVVDLFDCADGIGTTAPIDGIFRVWVQVENSDTGAVYAKSKSVVIDTIDGDALIDFPILDDGGYFFLTWDLVDAVSQAPLTCREAGIGGNGAVETVATLTGTSTALVDKFDCDDGFGTTSPLPAGSYTVSVDADDGTGAVGKAPTLTNKVIKAPAGLTDLGHILIPID